MEQPQRRVKVYSLAEDGTWEDNGVGHVVLQENLSDRSRSIIVVSETDPGPPLMLSRILPTNAYQRQGDGTIITWTDPEVSNDVAISFQHEEGCEYIWKELQSYKAQMLGFQSSRLGGEQSGAAVQQQQQSLTGMIDEVAMERSGVDKQGVRLGQVGQLGQAENFQRIEMPELEVGNLQAIAKVFVDLHPCHREGFAVQIRESDFLTKLSEIFHILEDVEDEESLQHVNSIMKGLVMLNDPGILEIVFSDGAILDTIGMLEYDSSFPEKQNHRETLKSEIKFKEVVPIQRGDVLSKIHQTFKISYIKDTILPIVLDDATFGTLSSIIMYNNIEILQALASDPDFFSNLFDKMKNTEKKTAEWVSLVDFVQELCDHAKHLQVHQRHQLFLHFIRLGLFDITSSILRDSDDSLRLKGMDVMMSTLHHDPTLLRGYLMQDASGENSLMVTMMDTLLLESQRGLQEQISDVIRMLLDPESIQPVMKENKNEFWDVFYENYFGKVVGVLTPDSNPITLVLVLDLLCFCVHAHSMWIKYFFLRNKIVHKVSQLMHRREKVVVLAALRLLRACVGIKDEFYYTQITGSDAFAPVVQAFLANGEKYNMLNSAVLELFEYMKKENLRMLIKYSIEKFWDKLSGVEYVQSFRQLKLKHEQNLNNETMRMEGDEKTVLAEMRLSRMRKRRDGSMEKEEEDYFESDEGEDPGPSAPDPASNTQMDVSASMEMDVGEGEGVPVSASPSHAGTAVLLNSSSPLAMNPLVDYDLDDTGNSPPGQSTLYTKANAPPPVNGEDKPKES
ncbi:DUF625 domain-containing protein [Chloropicon primus]|uniref:DUF625 domain-containing protein n=1 Tax=Chloropicon primus TaxID=1764295 RepID=A0A5B8MVW0_9CHLO|nr:DUF625 domain-containing protein [Chloropicon primus]|mmetsp:Transcript_3497/g.9839  ORF Transcript_3497/g.9839 Transcript_3497/m.9839 type:complete len:791 (-) Transcript_3497:1509-3881(-)|eukprot:QDZ24679.1 DUF625 domain-containing protein [Chloropicon primus]